VASTVSAADGTFTMQEPPTGSLKSVLWGRVPDYVASLLYPITIHGRPNKECRDLALSKKLQLLSPANGATVTTTTPTLQWAEFPDAARYEVRVFSSAMNQAVFSQSTQSAQVTVPSTLQLGQQYQWDVYAYNSRGQGIARGSGRSFTIKNLAQPRPELRNQSSC